MSENHTLGRMTVRAGEILTFTFDESAPDKGRHLTVVAIEDINLSLEMALFCEQTDRSRKDIYTENALPAFIQHLAEKRLLHVGNEVRVYVGEQHRPASRLMNEYKFRLNPESFWEDKLVKRYETCTFTVPNHQGHTLMVLTGTDAPFTVHASIVDMQGDHLGHLRLAVLPDQRNTLLNEEDIERLRLGLQADITMYVDDITVMVERVTVTSNPDFGCNAFKRHLPAITSKPLISKPPITERCTE